VAKIFNFLCGVVLRHVYGHDHVHDVHVYGHLYPGDDFELFFVVSIMCMMCMCMDICIVVKTFTFPYGVVLR